MAEHTETSPTNPSANPPAQPKRATQTSTTPTPSTQTSESTSQISESSSRSNSGECELLKGSCKNEVKWLAKSPGGAEIKVCDEHKNLVNETYPGIDFEFEEINT